MVFDGETPESRSTGATPALYVFDNPNGKGFVIVAGDDMAQPILGYSYENDFVDEIDNMEDHARVNEQIQPFDVVEGV